MSIELGVLIAPSADGDDAAVGLARIAEASGLDLVVVSDPARAGDTADLDPWNLATWLVARTERIAIGVSAPGRAGTARGSAFGLTGGVPDADGAIPSVVARGLATLDVLAPGRLVAGAADGAERAPWRTAPRNAGLDEVAVLAEDGLPVVIPVSSTDEVERVAGLARDLRSGAPARRGRSAAVRSRRVEGIAYDDVPASLADHAVEPGDRAHRSVASTYLRGGEPGLVLRPRTVDEVVDAVAFARRHPDLPLGLRSGGHGVSGRSTNQGGLVIDVGAMDDIEVLDRERRLVRIGPGATWKLVAAALHPYGWALGSGDYGGVGVGGLATAGGIGLLSRARGLTIDHLRAVELVLADGTPVRASADEHPELFWAVRGAGANFGVATAFEFEVDGVADVGWAKLIMLAPDTETALRDFGRLASSAPRDTTAFLVTGPPRQGQSVLQLYAVVDRSDPDVVLERLTPFTELGALAQQEAAVMPYNGVMGEAADVGPEGHHGLGEPVSRSAFLPALTPEFARDAARLLRSGVVVFFQLRTMGGAIADVAPEAMAFPHRSAAFQVTAMGRDDAALNAAWDGLRHHFDGLYLSFETDRRAERLIDAFTEPGLNRLRALKRRFDPGNLFRDNFNIDPGTDPTIDPATDPATDLETAA